jgi:hypothetical protein
MNYLPDLRSSLVSAAERATAGQTAPRRRRWSVTSLRGIPVALGVAVAVAVAVLALTHIRHRTASHRPAPTTAQTLERQALLDVLAVLRRPQTPADLDSKLLTRALEGGFGPFQGPPDRALIRRATTTPWGSPVFLVPVRSGSVARAEAALGRRHLPAALVRNITLPTERLAEIDSSGSGGGSTAADIEAGHALSTQGAGRSFAGGSTRTRIILIVPDGVAKVAFVLPRQANRASPGAPDYRRSLTVVAPVHGNVAALQVPRECCGSNVPMIWYAADGHVVKRLGDFRNVNRVLPTPQPGPQTPQSRAAQRDPSTPNRVWVKPATGGPHASYTVHFRILLNDADYRFHVSGTRCPQITFAGGQGGGAGDIRGRTFGGLLDAVHGQTWCPGTYHVSVTVMDLGRAGNLKHPANPFGTATFVVRR